MDTGVNMADTVTDKNTSKVDWRTSKDGPVENGELIKNIKQEKLDEESTQIDDNLIKSTTSEASNTAQDCTGDEITSDCTGIVTSEPSKTKPSQHGSNATESAADKHDPPCVISSIMSLSNVQNVPMSDYFPQTRVKTKNVEPLTFSNAKIGLGSISSVTTSTQPMTNLTKRARSLSSESAKTAVGPGRVRRTSQDNNRVKPYNNICPPPRMPTIVTVNPRPYIPTSSIYQLNGHLGNPSISSIRPKIFVFNKNGKLVPSTNVNSTMNAYPASSTVAVSFNQTTSTGTGNVGIMSNVKNPNSDNHVITLKSKLLSRTNCVSLYTAPNSDIIPVSKQHTCQACGDSFLFKSSLESHLNRRSVKLSYKCKYCSSKARVEFYNKCELWLHLSNHVISTAADEVSGSSNINSSSDIVGLQMIDLQSVMPPFDAKDADEVNNFQVQQLVKESALNKTPEIVNSTDKFVDCEVNLNPISDEDIRTDEKQLKTPVGGMPQVSWNCPECFDEFEYRSNLADHFRKKNKEFTKSCQSCHLLMPNKCAQAAHNRVHRHKYPYVCPECGKSLLSLSIFKRHLSDKCFHTSHIQWLPCYLCPDLGYQNTYSLKSHFVKKHMVNFYRCTHCPVAYKNHDSTALHVSTEHKISNPKDDVVSVFQCSICNVCYVSMAFFMNHLDSHLTDGYALVHPRYQCKSCGIIYDDIASLASHHAANHKRSYGSCQFMCDYCGINQKSRDDELSHEPAHWSYIRKKFEDLEKRGMLKYGRSVEDDDDENTATPPLPTSPPASETPISLPENKSNKNCPVESSAKTSAAFLPDTTPQEKESKTDKCKEQCRSNDMEQKQITPTETEGSPVSASHKPEYANECKNVDEPNSELKAMLLSESCLPTPPSNDKYQNLENLFEKVIKQEVLSDEGNISDVSSSSFFTDDKLKELEEQLEKQVIGIKNKIKGMHHECKHCQMKFETLKKLKDHKCLSVSVSCTLCSEMFSDNQELTDHMVTCGDDNSCEGLSVTRMAVDYHTCRICKNVYYIKKDLDEHLHIEHGFDLGSQFLCLLCGLAYENAENLKNHTKNAHGLHRDLPYYCPVCKEQGIEKSYKCKGHLVGHMNKIHKMNRSKNLAARISELMAEIESKIGQNSDDASTENSDETSIIKRPASFSLSDDTPALKRVRLEGDEGYFCAKCPFSSEIKSEFEKHIKSHKIEDESFQCRQCGLCFSVIPSLKRHLLLVHKVRNIAWYVANLESQQKATVYNSALYFKLDQPFLQKIPAEEENVVSVDGDKLECNVCYKVFRDVSVLKSHMRTHGMAFIKSKRNLALL